MHGEIQLGAHFKYTRREGRLRPASFAGQTLCRDVSRVWRPPRQQQRATLLPMRAVAGKQANAAVHIQTSAAERISPLRDAHSAHNAKSAGAGGAESHAVRTANVMGRHIQHNNKKNFQRAAQTQGNGAVAVATLDGTPPSGTEAVHQDQPRRRPLTAKAVQADPVQSVLQPATEGAFYRGTPVCDLIACAIRTL